MIQSAYTILHSQSLNEKARERVRVAREKVWFIASRLTLRII